MLKKSILFLLFLLCQKVRAQDIHFSQFFNSPQNLNPALTGLFNGDYRIAANHKNQWRTIPVPYRTYSISGDAKLPISLKNDIVAAGIVFTNDKSGDGSYLCNQASLSLSYIKKLNRDSTSFLSLGCQPTLVSKTFNLSKLTFDNQFNDGSYNAAIANGENFSSTKNHFFDLTTGIGFLQNWGTHSAFQIGISYAHFLKQNTSYFSDNSVVLNPKFSIQSSITFGLTDNFELIPVALYETQNKNKELVTGALARFILEKRADKLRAFSIGALLRQKDAFIVDAQLDYNQFKFGLSYDVTTSSLKKANNGLGGFELSLIYIVKRFVRVHSNKVICPVFL